jgi:hypothetical protein
MITQRKMASRIDLYYKFIIFKIKDFYIMTNKRKEEIKTEAKRRLDNWLKNSTFEEMTVGGSFVRFDMTIGLLGYPFKLEHWMSENDVKKFVTIDEFTSPEYKEILNDLFETAYSESNLTY